MLRTNRGNQRSNPRSCIPPKQRHIVEGPAAHRELEPFRAEYQDAAEWFEALATDWESRLPS